MELQFDKWWNQREWKRRNKKWKQALEAQDRLKPNRSNPDQNSWIKLSIEIGGNHVHSSLE